MNSTKPAISGQSSNLSIILSPSESGQPLNSTKPAISGHSSSLSINPSPSVSGQPLKAQIPGVEIQLSFKSETLSLSLSLIAE